MTIEFVTSGYSRKSRLRHTGSSEKGDSPQQKTVVPDVRLASPGKRDNGSERYSDAGYRFWTTTCEISGCVGPLSDTDDSTIGDMSVILSLSSASSVDRGTEGEPLWASPLVAYGLISRNWLIKRTMRAWDTRSWRVPRKLGCQRWVPARLVFLWQSLPWLPVCDRF